MADRWSPLAGEHEITRVKPSNTKLFLLLVCTLLLYLPWFIVRFTQNRFRTWILTNRRVIAQSGVFNQQTATISLERLQQVQYFRRFFDRIVGTGSLQLESAADEPGMRIDFIREDAEFRDALQHAINARQEELRERSTPGGV